MKFKPFFLSFFCVTLCGAFFIAAYFVYKNSQSVFTETEHLSVVLEENNNFLISSGGKEKAITVLPDLKTTIESPFLSPIIRCVAAIYYYTLEAATMFLKNFSEIT